MSIPLRQFAALTAAISPTRGWRKGLFSVLTLVVFPGAAISQTVINNYSVTVLADNSPWLQSSLVIGQSGNGLLNIGAGGKVVTSGRVTMAENSSAVGEVNISDGGTFQGGNIFWVGKGGTGRLYLTNGALLALDGPMASIRVGEVGNGTVNVSNSTLTAPSMILAEYGTANVRIEAGSQVSLDQLSMAPRIGTATLVVTDPGTRVYLGMDTSYINGGLYYSGVAGYGGSAYLQVLNGAKLFTHNVASGDPESTGRLYATVSGAGSEWINEGGLTLKNEGGDGSAYLKVTNGGYFSATYLEVGAYAGRPSVLVTGPGSRMDISGDITIGAYQTPSRYSTGVFNVEDGGKVTVGLDINLGDTNGIAFDSNVLTVRDAGSEMTTTRILYNATRGWGVLNIENGGKVSAAEVINSMADFSKSELNLKGTAGARGILETGSVVTGRVYRSNPSSWVGNAKMNFDGGILRANKSNDDFIRGFTANTVTIGSGGAFFDTNGYNVGLRMALKGNGSTDQFTKMGAGTLTLYVPQSFLGTTTVEGGLLKYASGVSASGKFVLNGGGIEITDTNTVMQSLSGRSGTTIATGTGSLFVDQSVDTIYSGTISGTGLGKAGSGQLTLEGVNTYSGGTLILGGTLAISANYNLGSVASSGPIGLDGGALKVLTNVTTARNLHIANFGNGQGGTINTVGDFTVTGTMIGDTTLTKTGAGALTLQGNQTHTGAITLSQGILRIQDGTLNSSTVSTSSGTRFLFSGSGSYGGTVTGGGALEYESEGRFIYTGAATNTGGTKVADGGVLQIGDGGTTGSITGDVALGSGGTLTFKRSDSYTLGGNVSGDGVIRQSGTGILNLSGNNSHSGGTTLDSGTLGLASNTALGAGPLTINGGEIRAEGSARIVANSLLLNGSFTLGRSTRFDGAAVLGNDITITSANPDAGGAGSSDFYGAISGNNRSLTFQDGVNPIGAIILAGDNTYNGGTFIKSGTVAINASERLANTGALSVQGGTFSLGAFNETVGAFSMTDGAVTGTGTLTATSSTVSAGSISAVLAGGALSKTGSGTVVLTANNTYSGGTSILGGVLQVGNGGTTGSINGGVALSNGGTLTFKRSDANGFGGNISGNGVVRQSGTGTLNLSGNNSHTGGTILDSGTLGLASDTALGAGPLTINGGEIRAVGSPRIVANSLLLNGSFTLGRSTRFDGAAVLGNDITITSANPDAGGAGSSDFYGAISGSNRSLTFQDGANPIGTIILAGDNTYNGGTFIKSGTVAINASERLANTGALAITGGTFSMGAFNETVGAFSMTNGAVTGTGTLTTTGTTVSAGSISANLAGGALSKTGSGTVVLTGSNTYTGDTSISGGVLQIGNGGTTGSIGGAVVLSNNGALTFNRSNELTFSGAISGAGSLNKAGAGRLILTANSTHSGGSNITGGVLQVGNGGTTGSVGGPVAMSDGATLAFNRSASADILTIGSVVSGAGGVTIDSGSYVFSATNTFTGPLTLNGGVFGFGSNSALAGSGGAQPLIKAYGGLLRAAGDARSIYNNIEIYSTLGLGRLTNLYGAITLKADSSIVSTNIAANVPLTSSINGVISGSGRKLTFAESANPTGTIILGGDNTYDGGTEIGGGTVTINASERLANSGALTVSGGTFGMGAFDETVGAFSLTSGAVTGTGTLTATSSSVSSGSISAKLAGGALSKTGSGTVVLTGDNIYTGGTSVSGGVLQVGNGGTSGWINGNVALSNGGTLAFNRSDLYATRLTFGGNVSGSGVIKNSGTGYLSLSGNNSHTGGTVLDYGTLGLASDTALGAGPLTINGGEIRAVSAARNVSSAVSLNLNGDFTLGRSTSFAGAATLGANITITSANPDAGGASVSTFSGVISGAHSLTFQNGLNPIGTIELKGANTYSGGTWLKSGTLSIGHNNGLGTGKVKVAGGTLFIQNGVTVGNVITLGGGEYQRALIGSLVGAVNATSDLGGNDTMVKILGGTASSTITLTSSFSAEVSGMANDIIRQSDVYHFNKSGTDLYVLQLSVESALRSDSFLGWKSGDLWVNAVAGNVQNSNNATGAQLGFDGSFEEFQRVYGTALAAYVGAYGMDSTTNATWAVLNHNGDYSVVPEPSTWALIALGTLAIWGIRRRFRVSAI